MKQKLFSFSYRTAYRLVKKVFPDLYPNYFRMNRILKQGGYYTAAEQFGFAINNRTRDSKDWIQSKKNCLSAFGNRCPITGRTDKLHIHHIDFNKENNNPENLIPLWSPLHTLIHALEGFSKAWCE